LTHGPVRPEKVFVSSGGKLAEAWACLGYRRAFFMCVQALSALDESPRGRALVRSDHDG